MAETDLDPSDNFIVNRLRRASGLSDGLIATGLFTLIAQWALGYSDDITKKFDPSNIRGSVTDIAELSYLFFLKEWSGIILALALYFWFWSFRTHTNREMSILERLYPEGQEPEDWEKVTNKRFIRVLAVGIVVVFMLLAALLKHPALFALIMLFLSCQDIFANEILRDNLRRVFADHVCVFPEGDRKRALYAGRHAAVRRYWLDRPQLLRIVLVMSATLLILAATQLPLSFPAQIAAIGLSDATLKTIATLLLAIVILCNELVMRVWRETRNAEILAAERTFYAAKPTAATAESFTSTLGADLPQPAVGTAAQATGNFEGAS